MAIPDFQTLMLPVLREAANGEVKIGDVVSRLADRFQLSPEERVELLPSGRQTTFANRVHWAKSYLGKGGLVRLTRRGHFEITDRGRLVLGSPPARIDIRFLAQFPEFDAFRSPSSDEGGLKSGSVITEAADTLTPDDQIRKAHEQIERLLAQELLERIVSATPEFFERLVVKLLTTMGYGGSVKEAGRALGRSGDNGVDGVIDEDALGLDRIYVQAKRYATGNNVGPGEIRDFFGALDQHKASKGLFVTTSSFTASAKNTASGLSKRIVLTDGENLTKLMIRYGVGCRTEDTLEIKRLDEEFFDPS